MMDYTFSVGFAPSNCAGQSKVWISFSAFHTFHKQLWSFFGNHVFLLQWKVILVSLAQSVVVFSTLQGYVRKLSECARISFYLYRSSDSKTKIKQHPSIRIKFFECRPTNSNRASW